MKEQIQVLIGEYGWMFGAGALVLLFREAISNLVESILVFAGNDYNADDIVYLNDRPGRIVRMSFFKTICYLYDVDETGFITGGTRLGVRTPELKSMMIENPLNKLLLSSIGWKINKLSSATVSTNSDLDYQ